MLALGLTGLTYSTLLTVGEAAARIVCDFSNGELEQRMAKASRP